MIKFFRKIRQNLLSEGKTEKYLKYAIGEIVLVVIGILIALQINTWNQYYQEKNEEKEVVSDLKASLINTELKFKELCSNYEKNIENMNFISNHLKLKLPCTDELKRKWISVESYPEPLFEIGIYENFKNNSMQLIKNDSLKTAIIQFYEAQLPNISDKLINNIESISTTTLLPLNVQNFTYGSAKMTPNNYENLLNNQQYFNAISYVLGIKRFTLSSIREHHERLKLLINEIENYQNQLE
jgi:hypothetical protein